MYFTDVNLRIDLQRPCVICINVEYYVAQQHSSVGKVPRGILTWHFLVWFYKTVGHCDYRITKAYIYFISNAELIKRNDTETIYLPRVTLLLHFLLFVTVAVEKKKKKNKEI